MSCRAEKASKKSEARISTVARVVFAANDIVMHFAVQGTAATQDRVLHGLASRAGERLRKDVGIAIGESSLATTRRQEPKPKFKSWSPRRVDSGHRIKEQSDCIAPIA